MSAETTSDRTYAQAFLTSFQASRTELEASIAAAQSATPEPQTLQDLSQRATQLGKQFTDATATGTLAAYDQRQCELQLKSIEAAVEALRASNSAQPKFSFKRKAKAVIGPVDAPASSAVIATTAAASSPDTASPSAAFTFDGLSNQYLTRASLPANSAPPGVVPAVILTNLQSCIVHIPDDLSAVQARRLTRCVLVLPAVKGSVMLYDLRECVVVVVCRQFRMHTSRETSVLLATTSVPVIESCSRIRVGGVPSALSSEETLLSKHSSLQDFSHVRASAPSPNWTSLSLEEERKFGERVTSMLEERAADKDCEGSVESAIQALYV